MNQNIFIKELHASDHANLVLLNRTYSIQERKRWYRARESFLREKFAKHGKLICYYCGRDDLELKAKIKSRQATVDHVLAISLGGNEFDKSNFAVACSGCNKKKGCDELETFVNGRYLTTKKQHTK